jgi:hypothetical protein
MFMLAGKTEFYVNNFWCFYPTGWTGFDRQDESKLRRLRDKRRVEHKFKLTSEFSTQNTSKNIFANQIKENETQQIFVI